MECPPPPRVCSLNTQVSWTFLGLSGEQRDDPVFSARVVSDNELIRYVIEAFRVIKKLPLQVALLHIPTVWLLWIYVASATVAVDGKTSKGVTLRIAFHTISMPSIERYCVFAFIYDLTRKRSNINLKTAFFLHLVFAAPGRHQVFIRALYNSKVLALTDPSVEEYAKFLGRPLHQSPIRVRVKRDKMKSMSNH